jgi:threonine synthase
MSPAMDIQVASNFERLLYEAHGRDAKKVRALMDAFAATNTLTMHPTALSTIRDTFAAYSVNEAMTANTIRDVHAALKVLIDPHTAVAAFAGRSADKDEYVVVLATAHPAKFPEAMEKAAGVRPQLPERLRWILTAPERYDTLPNDLEALKTYIAKR